MKADPRELDAQDRADLAFIASQLGQIAAPRNRDAAEQYLRAKKATTEVSTRRNYAYSLRLLDNVTTGRPYFELSRADVQDFMAALCDALGPTSVAAVARDLRTFYRHADPDTLRPLSWWNAWRAPRSLHFNQPSLRQRTIGFLRDTIARLEHEEATGAPPLEYALDPLGGA